MIRRCILTILLCVVVCFVVCGCFNPTDRSIYPFDHVCYIDGRDVYAHMAELSVAESYTTPDGKEFLPEDGGELWIVKGKLHIDPWHIVSDGTYLDNSGFKKDIPLFCDPIIEQTENGESEVTFLFCVKETDYRSEVTGWIYLQLRTANADGRSSNNTFVLEDFDNSTPPLSAPAE